MSTAQKIPKEERIPAGIIFLILLFFSFVLNIFLSFIIFKSKKVALESNIYLNFLCICHAILSLLFIFNVIDHTVDSWLFSGPVCKIQSFLFEVFIVMSTSLIIMICVHRYRTIFQFYGSGTKRATLLKGFMLLLISVAISFATLYIYNAYEFDSKTVCCVKEGESQALLYTRRILYVIKWVILMTLPVVFMIVLYTRIILKMSKGNPDIVKIENGIVIQFTGNKQAWVVPDRIPPSIENQTIDDFNQIERDRRSFRIRKALFISMLFTGIYTLFFSQFVIFRLIDAFHAHVNRSARRVSDFLFILYLISYPMIYVLTVPDHRNRIKTMFSEMRWD
ncbi:hypothetical protein RF11_14685 [Thelohanellus kitauei]|uniref:G-protein coupled receptors family 1 profile domain-containing protein n=1 Tax=Thelohanellus kitauei TaxID=669202 RepID=A0A0C2IZW9_THEKT|nr:hypothetical protein RF11_14685 [Thelohanellus kitauei]